MMDANQNPPSERDWTIEEQEAFYASHDAVKGLLGGGVATNRTPSEVLPPITLKGLQDTYADFQEKFFRGIHITSIVPPEQGWPIVAHCDMCKKTVIGLSPGAIKPEKGDYWKMEGTCLDEEKHIRHNMYPEKFAPYPWPLTPILGDVK
jgi:hypothetical protein